MSKENQEIITQNITEYNDIEAIKKSKRSKRGYARAASLSPERRKEISQRASLIKENPTVPIATHMGKLQIGDITLPCAVLKDGTRLLSEHGISTAVGSRSGSINTNDEDRANMPDFLRSLTVKSFISSDIIDALDKPVRYIQGNRIMIGYKAHVLPGLCEAYLKARDAGMLQKNQMQRAQRSEMLMRSLAHVGIIALVDEATGYQEIRDRTALQVILDKYLLQEYAAWAKKFPDAFFKEIFRLRGWTWEGMQVKKPQCVGHYINDIVYKRLAPGILEELKRRNPADENNCRLVRHHQWLTTNVGHQKLNEHLSVATTCLKLSKNWEEFMSNLNKLLPYQHEIDVDIIPKDLLN